MNYEEIEKKLQPFFDCVTYVDENKNRISLIKNKEKKTITQITLKTNGEIEKTVYKKGD